jgi:hypothetical protein
VSKIPRVRGRWVVLTWASSFLLYSSPIPCSGCEHCHRRCGGSRAGRTRTRCFKCRGCDETGSERNYAQGWRASMLPSVLWPFSAPPPLPLLSSTRATSMLRCSTAERMRSSSSSRRGLLPSFIFVLCDLSGAACGRSYLMHRACLERVKSFRLQARAGSVFSPFQLLIRVPRFHPPLHLAG